MEEKCENYTVTGKETFTEWIGPCSQHQAIKTTHPTPCKSPPVPFRHCTLSLRGTHLTATYIFNAFYHMQVFELYIKGITYLCFFCLIYLLNNIFMRFTHIGSNWTIGLVWYLSIIYFSIFSSITCLKSHEHLGKIKAWGRSLFPLHICD